MAAGHIWGMVVIPRWSSVKAHPTEKIVTILTGWSPSAMKLWHDTFYLYWKLEQNESENTTQENFWKCSASKHLMPYLHWVGWAVYSNPVADTRVGYARPRDNNAIAISNACLVDHDLPRQVAVRTNYQTQQWQKQNPMLTSKENLEEAHAHNVTGSLIREISFQPSPTGKGAREAAMGMYLARCCAQTHGAS